MVLENLVIPFQINNKTSGEVIVWGFDLDKNPRQVRVSLGIVPQEINVDPFFTPKKLLDLQAGLFGVKKKDRITDTILDLVALKDKSNSYTRNLSGGMKRRLMIAKAMVHSPQVLILDEPVTGLDPNQIVEIRSLIKSLGKEKLVFMSSHILQEIQATVDKIIIIDKGKIVANGTNEELMSDFMGNVSLEMEVMKATKKSAQELQAKIPSVKFISMEKSGGVQKVNFEYPKDKDPREDIFKYAVKSKWVILKMMPQTTNLEDIFRNLTSSGASN